jgi:hypothetical protein
MWYITPAKAHVPDLVYPSDQIPERSRLLSFSVDNHDCKYDGSKCTL